jgi:hypothetical protein
MSKCFSRKEKGSECNSLFAFEFQESIKEPGGSGAAGLPLPHNVLSGITLTKLPTGHALQRTPSLPVHANKYFAFAGLDAQVTID